MATVIVAVQGYSQLKECFKDVYRISGSWEHDTVVATAVDVLPMEPILNENVKYLSVSFEASPVQRMCLHFLTCAHHNMAIFWFFLHVGSQCSFRVQDLDQFVESQATCPDHCVPFLLGVNFWVRIQVPSNPISAFFFKHFSTYSMSFFFTAANIRSFRIVLFFPETSSYSDYCSSSSSMLSIGGS